MTFESSIPSVRIRNVGSDKINNKGEYVLYWMIANRRSTWNFSLQRAVEWSRELNKPLVVFEALRAGYEWASDRIHAFVIEGMIENEAAFSKKPVTYYPYLEQKHGDGRGLLEALGKKACVVVSDDFPCFFLPRMVQSATKQIPVTFELIDSNGMFPMRATDRIFSRAYDFRRFLQKNLLPHLSEIPKANPFTKSKGKQEIPKLNSLPANILKKWPAAKLDGILSRLGEFKIDHDVPVSPILRGGASVAKKKMTGFLKEVIDNYGDMRNEPTKDATSGLAPYLHFGHISSAEVFQAIRKQEAWSEDMVAEKAKGSSRGWWGLRDSVEGYLDQIITWRELGYNMCWQREDYTEYSSLPDWARKTMREHAKDRREYLYSLEEFETAQTHDHLWNAAQTQLVREGRMHNYLRMLWGKKIYEWSAKPEHALDVMIELNNKYALDGRNPNSYSGIFWVLGRYDRAWGPERPIFGKIRYMSSDNTARKVKVKPYLAKYSRESQANLF